MEAAENKSIAFFLYSWGVTSFQILQISTRIDRLFSPSKDLFHKISWLTNATYLGSNTLEIDPSEI
jgi:hypothetical protein